HERQLGPGEAADRRRRRHQSVGHLRRNAAVPGAPLAHHARRRSGHARALEQTNNTTGTTIVKMLLDKGANPNAQLFFQPANLSGTTNTRGATPLIRAANNNDLELVKLLLE